MRKTIVLSCASIAFAAALANPSISTQTAQDTGRAVSQPRQAGAIPQETTREAFWIWTGIEGRPQETVRFRQRLRLSSKPVAANLVVESRGPYSVFVNGLFIKRFKAGAQSVFLTRYLDKGPGVLAFEVNGGPDAAGLRFELTLRYADGRTAVVYSNGDEAVSREAPLGWQTIAFDDSRWQRSTVLPNPAAPPAPRVGPKSEPEAGIRRSTATLPPLPASHPDTTRLVRLWDIRGRRRPRENPYAGARSPGERMLLSCGMAPDEDLSLLASAGISLLESGSEALNTPETAPGIWDLSLPDSDRARADRAGFAWSYFPHFAFPPEWRRQRDRFTPIRCLEHDEALPAFSPWDPVFARYTGEGYASLAKAFGGPAGAEAIDIGVHGDYGEAGLFSGARLSVPRLRDDWTMRFGEPHDHLGWWCGDPLARADFRGSMMAAYRSLDALNRAWRTTFSSSNEITYPTSPTDGSRRRWLDFVHWYRDSVTRATEAIVEAARREFPGRSLMLPLGFRDEDPRGGNDNTALVKMAGRLGVDARSTHGGFRPFAENQATEMGRIASAARFYDVPFWNEATGKLSPEEETARFFGALSLGAKGLFDWPENVKSARDVYYRYGKNLRVERPVVDVAMFYPTTTQLLRQDGYLPTLARGCTEIRDVLNYDIVDERMVQDGALSRYRLLVLWEGTVVDGSALAKIREWVENGGVLVAYDFGKVETPEGDRTWFADLFGYAGRLKPLPNPVPGEALDRLDLEQLRTEWARPLGRGWTVYYPARRTRIRTYYELVRFLTYHLSELDRSKRDALAVDDAWDGVYATLLTDKAVFYNPGKPTVALKVTFPAAAMAAQTDLRVRPSASTYNVSIEGNGIAVLPFEPGPQELLYQCEAFRTLNGLKPSTGPTFHPGAGPTHVLIPAGKEISTRIRVDVAGTYELYYRATRNGALARAVVLVDGKVFNGGVRSPSAWAETLKAGTVTLTAGLHTLTIRPPVRQAIRADFVVLTDDPTIAGYTFGEQSAGR